MVASAGSTWWCEVCARQVWVRQAPKRLRCRLCWHWMTRTH